MTASFAVDSSAIIAILNREPEAAQFGLALDHAPRVIGWPTVFEVRLWIVRRARSEVAEWFDRFVRSAQTSLAPFDGELEALATMAYDRFGKGRHPAKLNFGDCMAYAVARSFDLPLLFKGGDFGLTDARVHPASVAA